MGYYNRMAFWRHGGADVHAVGADTNIYVKVNTPGANVPIEHKRSWTDWFFRRDHAEIKHKEVSKTQTASQIGSILQHAVRQACACSWAKRDADEPENWSTGQRWRRRSEGCRFHDRRPRLRPR
jgi:hypothetical protein